MDNEVEIVVKSKDEVDYKSIDAKTDALTEKVKRAGSVGFIELNKRIEETKVRVAELWQEFEETGDFQLLGDIAQGEGELKRLSGWLKHVKKDTEELGEASEEAEEKVGFFGRTAASLSEKFPKVSSALQRFKRDAKEAGDESEESSKKIGFIGRSANSAGDALARAFPTGSAFFNPVILGATAVAASLVAIPALAVTTGVALVGVGVGFLAAAGWAVSGSKDVQNAAKSMGTAWTDAVRNAGRGTEDHFVKALNILQGTAGRTGPVLARVFDETTPSVENLARGLDGLVKNALPGLEEAGRASGKVMDEFGAKLPETGDALSDFFSSIADGADGGVSALNTTLGMLNANLGLLGEGLEHGSKAFDFFTKGAGKFVAGSPGVIVDIFGKTKKGAEDAAEGTTELEKAMDAASRATFNLLDAQMELNGGNLSVEKANQRLQRSFDSIGDSVKDNGTSLDRYTEKGNANREALAGQIEANLKVFESTVASGKSVQEATVEYDKNTDRIRANAIALGFKTEQIDAMFGALGRLPDSKNVLIGVPGAIKSRDTVKSVRSEIERLKDKRVQAIARGDSSQVREINRQIALLHNKEVWLTVTTVRKNQSGSANAAEASMGGGVYGRAHGGISGAASGGQRGGMTWVGEQGPELVQLPYGSTVHPAATSRAMAGAGGGGGPVEVLLSAKPTASNDLMNKIIELLRYEIRNGGGDTQRFLGQG